MALQALSVSVPPMPLSGHGSCNLEASVRPRHAGSALSRGTRKLFLGHKCWVTGQTGKARRTGPLALRIFRAQGLLDFKKQETGSLFFFKREVGSGNHAFWVSWLVGSLEGRSVLNLQVRLLPHGLFLDHRLILKFPSLPPGVDFVAGGGVFGDIASTPPSPDSDPTTPLLLLLSLSSARAVFHTPREHPFPLHSPLKCLVRPLSVAC